MGGLSFKNDHLHVGAGWVTLQKMGCSHLSLQGINGHLPGIQGKLFFFTSHYKTDRELTLSPAEIRASPIFGQRYLI